MNFKLLFDRAVRNWPAKVLSLALAIIIFVFHRMATLEERFYSVPLSVENLNSMMPSGNYPRMVRLTLRGETHGIFSIMEDDIEVYVDMDEFDTPGTFRVPVQWRKKGTALGIDPLQISVDPPEIIFTLDNRMSRIVPVRANFRGQPESGFIMTSYSLAPNQIIIDGPAGLMSAISELSTELIDLEGRQSNFIMTANIVNPNPLIVIRGRGTTDFLGNISQVIPVRNITGFPITISGLSSRFAGELEFDTGNINIEGENPQEVASFEAAADFLTVDASGITETGMYILPVLIGEAGSLSINVEPSEVHIWIHYAEYY